MKKCYFLGIDEIFDNDLMDHLADECEKVILSDNQIEFWFLYGYSLSFGGLCLDLVTHLRSKFPEKNIKIVRVIDPIKGGSSPVLYDEAYDNKFPLCLSDRYVFSPLMNESGTNSEKFFAQRANKVERWILRQMDVVFAYFYSNLFDSVLSQIKYAQLNCPAEVVHIKFDDTENYIEELIDTLLDERSKKILFLLKQDLTHREIGKAISVSGSRVNQIANKSLRKIKHELRKRITRTSRENDIKCALLGLSNNANALQLICFKGLLEYLSGRHGVKEYLIDEKSCNTPYGAILAMYCTEREFYGHVAKVAVNHNMNEVDQWDSYIKKYVPPYSSVIYFENDSTVWVDELIRQSNFIITDLESPNAMIIRNLCALEDNYLFNILRETLDIEEYY